MKNTLRIDLDLGNDWFRVDGEPSGEMVAQELRDLADWIENDGVSDLPVTDGLGEPCGSCTVVTNTE